MWFSKEKEEAQKLERNRFLEKNFKQTFNVFNQAGERVIGTEKKIRKLFYELLSCVVFLLKPSFTSTLFCSLQVNTCAFNLPSLQSYVNVLRKPGFGEEIE